jgi:hypothetical protein
MAKRLFQMICGATLIALLGAAVLPHQGWSQDKGIELGATYSYMWAGTYHLYEGEIHMEDGSQWGGIATFSLRPDTKLEFYYANAQSNATFYRYSYVPSNTPSLDDLNTPVTIQYFQLGSVYQIPKGKAQPFIGVYLGAVLFHPTGNAPQGLTYEDQWNFAISFAGGLKLYASDSFGVRLQGRLMLPMYFSSGSMYVGTGGAGVAVGAGIPVVQGDVGVGVFLRL